VQFALSSAAERRKGTRTLLHLPVHPFPDRWCPASQDIEAAETSSMQTRKGPKTNNDIL
jgi:hypothetical protein